MIKKIAHNYLEKVAKLEKKAQDFYNSIVQAETGSFKNPWIRTTYAPPEGSSAYGPAQLTRKKVTDYFKRFPEMMAPHAKFYNSVLGPMHDNFLKYGKEPDKEGYDKKWDYGGAGNPLTDQQKQQYEQLVRTMMAIDEQEARKMLPNGTPEQILNKRIALWRGAPQSDDNRYYKEFHSVYNKQKAKPVAIPSTSVQAPVRTNVQPSNVYTVRPKDTLGRIVAARGIKGATNIYNMVNKIKKINNMNSDIIKPGQQLKLPEGL